MFSVLENPRPWVGEICVSITINSFPIYIFSQLAIIIYIYTALIPSQYQLIRERIHSQYVNIYSINSFPIPTYPGENGGGYSAQLPPNLRTAHSTARKLDFIYVIFYLCIPLIY